MPEILDIRNDKAPEWAAIEAISELERVDSQPIFDIGNPLTVELKINGVEVKFSTIINKMKTNALRWAQEEAKSILDSKSESLRIKLQTLERIADDVESELKIRIRQEFPDIRYSDD